MRATSRTPMTTARTQDPAGRRPSISRRGPALASSVLAAVLLAGCAGGAAGTAAPDTGSPATTSAEVSPSPASDSADPTGDATVGQSTADDGTADEGAVGGTSGGGSGSPAPDDGPGDGSQNGTEGSPGWPIESIPVHGADYWAAYLAVGVPGDPALQRVLDDVRQLWPGAGLGELGCDEGAAAALGREPTDHAVAVYFETEEQLGEFRRRWDSPWVASVRVVTFCGD